MLAIKNYWVRPFILLAVFSFFLALSPSASPADTVSPVGADYWDKKSQHVLVGPWQVIRGKIIRPAKFESHYEGETTTFPDRWHDSLENTFNKDWPVGFGSASYRLNLRLPTESVPLAIKLQTPYSAYEVWMNGEHIASNGTVTETPEFFEAFYLERIIPLPQQTDIEIVLVASNFEHFAGGVLRPPILAPLNQLEQAAKTYDLSYLFVLGAISALLAFHSAYFFRSLSGHIEWSHFWYCILLSVLIVRLTTLTTMPHKLFPDTPQFSSKTLEYLTLFSSTAVYMAFLASMFPKEFPVLVRRINYTISLLFVACVIVTPVYVFTQLQDAFILFALIFLLYSQGAIFVAWRKKQAGASAVLLFTALFLITAVNDSLLYLHSFNVRPSSYPDLMPFGFLFLSVGYAIALSARSRAIYDHAQQLASQLLQLNKTLDQRVVSRTKEATSAQLSAEKSAKEKADFISAASHDLRQPVHALGLFNQTMIHSTQDKPDLNAIATKQHSLIGSLSEMLETMLEASKLEAKTIDTTVTEVPLAPLLKSIHDTLHLTALDNDVELTVVSSSHTILADPKHLKRVIINLATNAIKASSGGKVLIGARGIGHQVAVDILDNGVGITPEDQSQIFDRFVQLEQKLSSGPAGLGLGLSIVADFCDLMNMQLDLQSTPGKGTHFRITADKTDKPEEKQSTNITTHTTDRKRLILLVVDDDPRSLEAMVTMFRQWGHSARGANSYAEAIETLDDLGQPDLLVTDYRLSADTTGIDLYHAILAKHPTLRVVLVTGATAPSDLKMLSDTGLTVFHKPLKPDHMKTFLSNIAAEEGTKNT